MSPYVYLVEKDIRTVSQITSANVSIILIHCEISNADGRRRVSGWIKSYLGRRKAEGERIGEFVVARDIPRLSGVS